MQFLDGHSCHWPSSICSLGWSRLCTPAIWQFPMVIHEDPLKLSQIGRELLVTCKVHFSPADFSIPICEGHPEIFPKATCFAGALWAAATFKGEIVRVQFRQLGLSSSSRSLRYPAHSTVSPDTEKHQLSCKKSLSVSKIKDWMFSEKLLYFQFGWVCQQLTCFCIPTSPSMPDNFQNKIFEDTDSKHAPCFFVFVFKFRDDSKG